MKDIKYELTVSALMKYQDSMYRLAMSTVKDRDAALDVVQEASLKALEHYKGLRSPDSIKSWLFRIVINEALKHRASVRRGSPGKEELPEDSYHEPAYDREGEEVYAAVMRLPEQLRLVILLRYYEDLSLREISEVTGININTVKSRLYAAHKKLGADIKEEYL